MGIKVCDRELNSLMTLMDKDGSGCIDFEEFAEVMAEQFFREPSEAELEAAFDYFDQGFLKNFKKNLTFKYIFIDKSGYICEDELYMAMSHFKSNISRSDIQKMIEVVDRDNDSKINKKEFIYIVLNHKN